MTKGKNVAALAQYECVADLDVRRKKNVIENNDIRTSS
jgi:hypothetical protein